MERVAELAGGAGSDLGPASLSVLRDGFGLRNREHRGERGVALVAGALWFTAVLALAAIAIEVARLTDTATEVQIAADAAAFAGAVALGRNQTPSDAQAAGKSVAAVNAADGRLIDPSGVQMDIGHYDPSPSANPHFSTTCTPGGTTDACNAARATVTVSGVQYVMASILNGQAGTAVTKTAVAAAECPGSGYPNLPMAVCLQALQNIPQDETCGTVSGPFVMNPNAANNACWSSLGSGSASADAFLSLFPPQCGGSNQVELFAQEALPLQNGVDTKVWKALQCCVACQGVHDFTLPVIDCGAAGSCNTSPPLQSFATIHITNPTDINTVGSGNTNCGSFSWGCSQTIPNDGSGTITASQICKSNVPGKPSTLGCTNQATTVVVLGQLP